MKALNDQSIHEGMLRMHRPPVFIWAKKDIHYDHLNGRKTHENHVHTEDEL